jgi:hypothetical protein
LFVGAFFVVIAARFVILFTARFPRGTFDNGHGALPMADARGCLGLRLVTDRYPPFGLRS